MAIIQVDNYRELVDARGTRSLYGLDLSLREALSSREGAAEVLRLSESSYVAVFSVEREEPRAALGEVLAKVGTLVGTKLGAFLLPTPIMAEAFPDAFRLLQDAHRCDYLRGAGEIVEAAGGSAESAETEGTPENAADSGVDLSRLEKACRLGDTEEAGRRVDELLAALRASRNPDLFRYTVSTLARRIPDIFGADAETLLNGGADGFRLALSREERLAGAEALLRGAVGRLKDRGGHHAERRQRDVVDRVKAIVEERIADHALSTAAIAAEVSLSASYLRDLFKRIEGMALLEYVGFGGWSSPSNCSPVLKPPFARSATAQASSAILTSSRISRKPRARPPTEFREEAVRG
jgi:hypothetical protein